MKPDDRLQRVRFGPYEADFSSQELWKDGARLKLAGQPFAILEMLVRHAGDLVSRESLERRLWPEDHFVDARHGLNAAINKLRDTLDDSADYPQYIETLPRRGYRFMGKVEWVSLQVDDSEQAPGPEYSETLPLPALTEPTSSAGLRDAAHSGINLSTLRRWPMLATAALALAVGSFLGVLLTNSIRGRHDSGLESQKVLDERPENQEKARAEDFVLKPRAGGVVRVVPTNPQKSELDSLPGREGDGTLRMAEFRTVIPGNAGNAAPQFSPDGKRIAFMSNRSGPWQIWVSNADGSEPAQVSFTPSAGTPRWSPDGQSLAFDAPYEDGTHVFVVPVNAPSNARAIAEGRVPSFSRDGKFVYFASERTGESQVWKMPLSGGPEIQVTTGGGFAALESQDGKIYYSKTDDRNPEIWSVPVSGGAETAMSEMLRPRTWSSWTVTSDGILMVADLRDGRTELTLYDPAHRTTRELATLETAPHWMGATSDGKRVVMNDTAERTITMLDHLR